MDAEIALRDKYIFTDGAILEMVIWKLPMPDKERPHGIKYRLFYGLPGQCLVRYDNEKGKGDHRHYKNKEESYHFVSVEVLVEDFKNDVQRIRGEKL